MAQDHVQATPTQQVQAGMQHDDVQDWTKRFNETLANTQHITAPSHPDARPWSESFFGCFAPIDLCAITCCVPCVTFGKTHHRTRKDANMADYNAVNPTCLGFWASMCFGLHWIPMIMQRHDIRQKYNLQGDFVTDLLTSCCCGCCSLIQQEKESELREKELANKTGGYAKPEGMSYP